MQTIMRANSKQAHLPTRRSSWKVSRTFLLLLI